MEKELFGQYGSLGSASSHSIHSEDVEEVKKAEKKLKRQSTVFSVLGMLTLITGGALMIAPGGVFWGDIMVILGILGIGGAIVGFIKIMRDAVRGKSIKFPQLKLRRKPMDGRTSRMTEAPFTETTFMRKKFARSRRDKVFLGVSGGIAEYLGISPALIRILWVLLFIATSGGISFLYFILGIAMPIIKENENLKMKNK